MYIHVSLYGFIKLSSKTCSEKNTTKKTMYFTLDVEDNMTNIDRAITLSILVSKVNVFKCFVFGLFSQVISVSKSYLTFGAFLL